MAIQDFRLSWTLSRRLVQLALVTWFLYQCVVSVNKLLERKVGTAESSGHEEEFLYPSVAVCHVPDNFDQDPSKTVEEAYNRALESLDNRLKSLKQLHFTNSDDVNVTGTGNIEEYVKRGIMYEAVTSYNNRLLKCFVYNPPGMSLPGLPGLIGLELKLNATTAWSIFVHNKDMLSLTMTKPYGSTYALISSESARQNMAEGFEILRTKWTLVDTPKTPCTDPPDKILECTHRSVEAQMGCKLPWTEESPRGVPNVTCDLAEVNRRLTDLVKLGESHIAGETGCKGSCSRFSHRLRPIMSKREDIGPGEEATLSLYLSITAGNYDAKEQYIIYDGNCLISDIGGYLGLLLGQSLLTSYDMVLTWITRRK